MERPNWSMLHDMLDDVRKTVDNFDDMQKQVVKVTGVAWSEDGMIKATVGPRGQLVDLEIDPRIYRKPNSKALSASILTTVRDAVDDANRQTQQILDGLVPDDLRPGRIAGMDYKTLTSSHDADLAKGVIDDE